jgi:peptidoglycan biosynthesis protein MviN/MurJ (putative lipid II flippase)
MFLEHIQSNVLHSEWCASLQRWPYKRSRTDYSSVSASPNAYFCILAAYLGFLSVQAVRTRSTGAQPYNALRAAVCTIIPPIGWVIVLTQVFCKVLRWDKKQAIVASVGLNSVAFIGFAGWIGAGADKNAHSTGFYVAQLLAWFAVSVGLWISWIRSFYNGESL